MDLYAGMAGEARNLIRANRSVLDAMPRTFLVSLLIELKKWPTFFEPEKAYFRVLLEHLKGFGGAEREEAFGTLRAFESRTGCLRIKADEPESLRARTLAHLRKEGQYWAWRKEIEKVFRKIQPVVEEKLYASDRHTRLVILLYGEGITIKPEELWKRFRNIGIRVPLKLDGARASEPFLLTLFTGQPPGTGEKTSYTLFDALCQSNSSGPPDAWVIEAGDGIHALCEASSRDGGRVECTTGMSFQRLRGYREKLADAIYGKVLVGVPGPVELAQHLRSLEMTPEDGVSLYSSDVVLAFIRDILLAGNGTMIINNSFVEWAAVQALKRAQPRLLVARFGVRDKMKPFSSLLLFSKPRPTDQIPILEDPFGSFIDAELLSYYVWLNAEKGPPYRAKTVYLLLAEGVDEMLVVLPEADRPASGAVEAATLQDVAVTMAHLLGTSLPASPGRPIPTLVS